MLSLQDDVDIDNPQFYTDASYRYKMPRLVTKVEVCDELLPLAHTRHKVAFE